MNTTPLQSILSGVRRRWVDLIVAIGLIAAPGVRAAPAPGPANATSTVSASEETLPRFTFGEPQAGPRSRGGVTRGVPVTMDRTPSAAWAALQASGLDPQERDRRAILAMAGTWRVAFDFIEVASFPVSDASLRADAAALVPYQSWGTEKVYVDRDEPGVVSLVHVLEIHVVGPDGKAGEPIVTKHWRQEWRHEPSTLVEYVGRERWRQRPVGVDEGRGAWSQTVYQVDESPRYASVGRWQHNDSFSTWIGGDTWRPLPRREWTVRRDYQVLVGTNRHTILPTGWLQEENNLKTVLTPARAADPSHPFVGREYGVSRYERMRDADFADADRYYERTRAFWQRVEATWHDDFMRAGMITLRGQVDQQGFFIPLFERAETIAERGPSSDDERTIRSVLDGMREAPP